MPAYMVSVQLGLHGASVTHEEIRVNEKYCTRSLLAQRWCLCPDWCQLICSAVVGIEVKSLGMTRQALDYTVTQFVPDTKRLLHVAYRSSVGPDSKKKNVNPNTDRNNRARHNFALHRNFRNIKINPSENPSLKSRSFGSARSAVSAYPPLCSPGNLTKIFISEYLFKQLKC